MKMLKNIWKAVAGIAVALMILFPVTSINIHAAEYEIVFKAGVHGSIDGQKEASYRLSSDDYFPDEPDVQAEEGYVFTGWNKELPSVGSKVDGKKVYVAKYAVLINGVTYTIRYVDENKVDIATPRTMLAEDGSSVSARARNVAGYTYQQAEQTFTVKDGMEIQFIYTLTNPEEVIRYETTTQQVNVNQPANNTQGQNTQTQNNQGNNNANNNQNNNNNENNNQENVDDPEQPQGGGDTNGGEENLPENNTPKAGGNEAGNMMIAAVGGFAVLMGIILIIVLKKRKKENRA